MSIQTKSELVINWFMKLAVEGYSLALGVSFGKDSNTCLVLLLEAIRRCKAQGISIPKAYITHGATGVDNPSMEVFTQSMLNKLESWISVQGLDIDVIVAKPSMASSFHYQTLGRGVLPVFVEQSDRSCSIDWKLIPQKRALKRVIRDCQNPSSIVMLSGTRYEESTARRHNMIARSDGPTNLVDSSNDGVLSNAPIADWSLCDVWELLMAVDHKRKNGGLYNTFVEDFDWCLDIYRDSADGVCAIITGDNGPKAACGSRHGCWTCLASGASDKSMSSMIRQNPDAYSYLEGINTLRDYMHKSRFDFSKRDWIGRKVSDVNHVAICPNNYSAAMRRDLVRYMLTLDILEIERAEEHEGKIFSGELESSWQNEMLAQPMFELITPAQLVAIDMLWSTQYGFQDAFPALREWYEIRVLGKRYAIPDIDEPDSPPKIPAKRYVDVGRFVGDEAFAGLRDIECEGLNQENRPGEYPYRVYQDGDVQRRVVPFDDAPEFNIDSVEANLLITDDEGLADLLWQSAGLSSIASAKFWLDRRVVKPAKGRIRDFDLRARKAQYWRDLHERSGAIDLDQHLKEISISEKEHNALLAELSQNTTSAIDAQFDLFAVA